ncbi:hypothetical protein VTK26DRAFT_7158 [Humicola hyalothermophila]
MSAMVFPLRRVTIATFVFAAVVYLFWLLPRLLNPTPPDPEESERDKHWVNSSPYWIDRQACRWLGLCGIQHIRWDAPARPDRGGPSMLDELKKLALGWSEERVLVEMTGPTDWEITPIEADLKRDLRTSRTSGSARILAEVPDYVLLHAPLVHLYSGENFWPSDIREHVQHLKPYQDGVLVETGRPLDLGNLSSLNWNNGTVFLTSEDDVEWRPEWLHNRVGVPAAFKDGEDGDDGSGGYEEHEPPEDGTTWWDADREHPPKRIIPPQGSNVRSPLSDSRLSGADKYRPHRIVRQENLSRKHRRELNRRSFSNDQQHPMVHDTPEDNQPDPSGYSKAPAVLILVDKGAGILDAFWFFFYSYNLGQTVLKIRFGNHVGDWEHCMVRFQHGIPRAMFLSEHAGGKAYTWHALEKRAQKDDKPPRPVIYSAVGSHAMYASPGMHPYVLPFRLLKDITDKGPLWDPALNNLAYWYDYEVARDEAANSTIQEYTSLVPAASNPDAPTSWFHFDGFWGDDIYPLSDRRQWRLFGEYHYITGPLGPKAKWLDRRKVCQTEKCRIVDSIEAGKKSAWY